MVLFPEREENDADVKVLRYVTFDTQLGRFLVASSDRGLRLVTFGPDLDVETALAKETKGERVMAVEDRIRLRLVVDSIRSYLDGSSEPFAHRLDLGGATEFYRNVLQVVRSIPYGSLRSYKWVAEQIGAPRATRPVGQALSHNPVPIVVPCHRVVNSDGTIGGYSGGGPAVKRRLIEIETGQVGLALGKDERAGRKRIRFLLESEGGDGGDGRS